LHDEGAVFVGRLVQFIQLRNGLIESVFGQVAGLLLVLEDLIIANAIVERKTKADGVSGLEGLGGDFERLAVVVSSFAVVASVDAELSEVAVVVSSS